MSEHKPLVSIIIPTFGRSNLLNRAIKSVLTQDYENIEIIIVDDNHNNSKEKKETTKVILKYEGNSKIKYLDLKGNHGGAIARNKGIEYSSGEFICFLDDDDEYHKDKIRLQVEKFLSNNNKLSVVGCFANILDNDNNIKWIEKTELEGDMLKRQLSTNICTTSLAMIRKEYLEEINGFDNIPSSQEHMLFLKIFTCNPNYSYVNKVLVNIHHHDGPRISTNKNKPNGAIILHEFVQKYYKNLSNLEIKNIEKHQYINIIRSYLSINDKKNSYKYLNKFIKKYRVIDKDILKVYFSIVIGIEKLYIYKKKIYMIKNFF